MSSSLPLNLINGYAAWKKRGYPERRALLQRLVKEGQRPTTMIISCCDSRVDPTTIFNLFGIIPWDPPGFLIIGIWPILMGLTMYLQQKLNPAPPDPIQAKIFAFFPLLF